MSAYIVRDGELKSVSKKIKLQIMESQMKDSDDNNWGGIIGVIHLYIPKNMYDIMGSKVIEMSEELKAIKNPKITAKSKIGKVESITPIG